MKLRNVFQKKKAEAKRNPIVREKEDKEKTTGASLADNRSPRKLPENKWKGVAQYQSLLLSQHITEKATDALKQNQYIFKIAPKANKPDIKKAIERIYGVDVVNVRMITIHPTERRVGRQKGWIKGYKKAIVKLKKGQTIEVLSR